MAIVILGRIMFGMYFVISGISHFKDRKTLTGYADSKKVPMAHLLVLVTGVMLLVGGLGFVLNVSLPQSAVLLVLFLIPTSFIMHAFWKDSDPMHKMNNKINFMKNLAIAGALLMFI